ncbi:hypothetical protein [Spirosoma luteum]|uniref:hypothetical protein n=1 Tax=Spirosoma luteum TaxID=431553 RepID=UPI00035C3451|nr:hypothetical protein [Spirosoma luteum]
MKRTIQVLVIGLASMLAGCVSVNIQSNIKKEAQPEFSRILVESRLSQVGPTYLSSFQTSFPAGYQVCVVSNSVISFDSPEEAVEKQRQACQSEVVLTIDFKRNSVSASGKYAYSSNELYVEMRNLATGQPFWKAVVTTSGSVEVPASKIVSKLIDDGIVEARLPNNNPVQLTN